MELDPLAPLPSPKSQAYVTIWPSGNEAEASNDTTVFLAAVDGAVKLAPPLTLNTVEAEPVAPELSVATAVAV